MALINCPECGAQVSERALYCPACGHPISKPVSPWKERGTVAWMSVIVTIAIIALFALLGTCNWKVV